MNKKLSFLNITVLIFLLFFITSSVQAVGVRPLVVDLDLEPGDIEEFELIFTPSGKQETVALSLYHPTQQITGGLAYEEAEPERHSAAGWIELKEEEAVVPPDEEKKVRGVVNVPYDAEGSHTVVVMAEPVVDSAEGGITFQVRYAVRVNINVDRPGLRERGEVLDFGLEADDEDRPILFAHFENPSPLHYNAAAEVTVRDENRQLLERVVLRSQAATQAGRDEQRIYPGAEVLFSGEITEPLHPGSYELQLFMYYADGRQIIQRKTVEVGDEFLDPDRMEYIEVDPERMEEVVRPGASVTGGINVRNRTGDPVIIQIGGGEIEPEYPHSVFDAFELQLRGDQEFRLEGRRSNRNVLVLRCPREIESGGYYGVLNVGVFSEEGDLLEVRDIDIEVLVGDDHVYKGEFLDLEVHSFPEENFFSLLVENTGNVHLNPRARIYLRDDNEEIVRTLRLELQEGVKRILPGMSGLLTATTGEIEPGEYTADISIEYQGEELSNVLVPLEIEPPKEE